MKQYDELLKDIRKLKPGTWHIHDQDYDVETGTHGGAAMFKVSGQFMLVVWSCDAGWDHVSVSLKKRTPKYQEMKFVKRLFFQEDEWAIEYHPPGEDYISVNDNVLHLWRPHNQDIPKPPKIMV